MLSSLYDYKISLQNVLDMLNTFFRGIFIRVSGDFSALERDDPWEDWLNLFSC